MFDRIIYRVILCPLFAIVEWAMNRPECSLSSNEIVEVHRVIEETRNMAQVRGY